ncbi:MAG: dTMP kinase [Actinomycetota bacterium]|nr:dTMP kinase [Actinomycetota bacterium]
MAGRFITFEGIEGCGKSTQVELARNWFQRQHREVVVTREPGGTAIGDKVREILLDPELKEMVPRAEALLYSASRAQLITQVIKPALDAGKTVLCDRYIDSSLAYQVFARGLDFQTVISINEWATDGLMPDLTFLFRISAELGLGRAIGRQADRLEQEGLHFHRMVEAGYEDLAVKYAERFVLIDGRDPVEQIHKQVVEAIRMVL